MENLKPSSRDKSLKGERITLVENNKVVSDESKLVEIFSNYFGNLVLNLEIDLVTNIRKKTVRKAIEKYQNHPSINIIRDNIDTTNKFSFDLVNPECISKIINNLDTSRATQQGNIPAKVIKYNKELFSYVISPSLSNAVNKGIFLDKLKHADGKPIYNNESRNEKENYRPVSILPNLSKVFKLYMHDQLKDYVDKILLTDLSKVFDCLPQDLVIAKLQVYGIKKGSLNLLFSHLKTREQRVRLNNSYSECIKILFSVPQDSILDPWLCYIFMRSLFVPS